MGRLIQWVFSWSENSTPQENSEDFLKILLIFLGDSSKFFPENEGFLEESTAKF